MNEQLPKFASLCMPGKTEPFEVTMNKQTMQFYLDQGARVSPLVDAAEARNAIIAARAMMSIYQQCFARAASSKPGDKVMFDNGLIPLTPAEEHALMNVGIVIGGVYTVTAIFKTAGKPAQLQFDGAQPDRRFNSVKFLILPR